ncbi:MAG: Uma2 family endonuclease [Acidimicrobiales bacterium]
MSLAAHPDRPFDFDDLLNLSEDGLRYEVIDGALVVNAAPTWRHQEIAARLWRLLQDCAPPGVKVLPAVAWRIGPGQAPEPDLIAVERSGLAERAVEAIPMLVVEVLSPSNRGMDLVRKRALYAEGGCPCYWLVDPDGPTVTTLLLEGGGYSETGRFAGSHPVVVECPWPLRFVPADL